MTFIEVIVLTDCVVTISSLFRSVNRFHRNHENNDKGFETKLKARMMIVRDEAREITSVPDITRIFRLNMSASWMSPSSITSGLTTTREVRGVTNWYLRDSSSALSRLLQMIGSDGAPPSSWKIR